MLLGQQFPGAAQTGLDFVQDQHHVVFGRRCRAPPSGNRRRNDDAGLTLNGFRQESGGVGRYGRFQGIGIAEGDHLEPRGKGAESGACRGIGGKADNGDGAAVKIVGADDDFRLVRGNALYLVYPICARP
jgi:hypothetical protein